jgi:hypothetical protein
MLATRSKVRDEETRLEGGLRVERRFRSSNTLTAADNGQTDGAALTEGREHHQTGAEVPAAFGFDDLGALPVDLSDAGGTAA